jgi:glutamate synthase (ferredoxin)
MTSEDACYNWRKAMNKGCLKILSKIGISTLASYTGAQLFEAIGINGALIDRAFTGTPSRIGGLDVPEIGEETERFLTAARGDSPLKLLNYGFVMTRKSREFHSNAPHIAKLLQNAVKESDKEKRDEIYEQFKTELTDKPPVALRDLMSSCRRSRSRWRKLSRSKRSWSASAQVQCRSARFRARLTRPSRSR